MSFNTISYEPTAKWNDADVFGDLNSPETQSFLDKRFDALVGNSSKQPRGTWRLWSTSLRQMIEIKLSRHEAKQNKDGDAMVFARARTTGGRPLESVFELVQGIIAVARSKPQQDARLVMEGKAKVLLEMVV